MKKILPCLLGLILGLGFVSSVYAEQWQIVGPRALGMGGAHVAVVNDATASYWNPAAFGFFGRERKDKKETEHTDRDWGLQIHGGAGAQIHENLAEEVNDILNYNFDDLSGKALAGSVALADLDDIVKMTGEIRDLNKRGLGATVLANAGINTRVNNFGIGLYVLGEVSADPSIDLTNLGVGTIGSAISNLTGLGGTQQSILTSAQRTDLITTIDAMTGWSNADATAYVNSLDQALFDSGVPASTIREQDILAAKDVAQVASDIDASTGGGNLNSNTSNVLFKGAAVAEVPVTYGYAFNDHFSLGGNVKFMRATVFNSQVRVFDKDNDNFFRNFDEGSVTSNAFGVDLGGLAKL